MIKEIKNMNTLLRTVILANQVLKIVKEATNGNETIHSTKKKTKK